MGTSALAIYALGAAAVAGEAVVHVQQYVSLFHEVRWIGPLFLANAIACVAVIAGLAHARTRARASSRRLPVWRSPPSGRKPGRELRPGLFGWQEAGFRPVIELTLIF